MPLPLILGIGAATAGAIGIGTGVHGAAKMKGANDTMKLSKKLHDENLDYFEKQNKMTAGDMDSLGKKELEILSSLSDFASVFEKIHNRPIFEEYQKNGITIPGYNPEEIKRVSVGAGVLLGGLGGAAMGTAGGFAAAGATTAAVMALGTASTGTAIASLSGAAATNATLAALGGGALAAGGGGMALGTTVLGAATLGAGIMVGGIIFNLVGSSLSNKADEAYGQVRKEREEVNKICEYLQELSATAKKYLVSISRVYDVYQKQFNIFTYIVDVLDKKDWNDFTKEERLVTENTALLVGLLYNMGKVQLVITSTDESRPNEVNRMAVEESINDANVILVEKGFQKGHIKDLDWNEIKEILHTNVTDAEYYRWIDFLEAQVSKDSIKIVAPYKEAAQYVKENFCKMIEDTIYKYLNKEINVSYGYIDAS
ncbi:hypothetical protein [Enterocloster citroniae]